MYLETNPGYIIFVLESERETACAREVMLVAPSVCGIVVIKEHFKLVNPSVKKSPIAVAAGMMISKQFLDKGIPVYVVEVTGIAYTAARGRNIQICTAAVACLAAGCFYLVPYAVISFAAHKSYSLIISQHGYNACVRRGSVSQVESRCRRYSSNYFSAFAARYGAIGIQKNVFKVG